MYRPDFTAVGSGYLAAPVIVNRYDANREFAKNKVLRVRIYTQGLGFGTDDTFQLVPYEDCCARWCRDMILLILKVA